MHPLCIPIDQSNLKDLCREVIASCLTCHREFGDICKGDPMIYFKVPDKIGIGLAIGPACCLRSGDIIIDYSGRLLNLTSRLTDLARPSGIVIDGAFPVDLLTQEQHAVFQEDNNVYLVGIAEREPIRIYFTPEFTDIPIYRKLPIAAERWRNKTDVMTYEEFLKLSDRHFRYYLESEPLTPEHVKVTIWHPKLISGQIYEKGGEVVRRIFDFKDFEYRLDRGSPLVRVDFAKLREAIEQDEVREDMELTIDIDYVEK